MRRALLSLVLAAAAAGQVLDARHVVSHPARWGGDYAGAVEDLLARLEADPASPLAPVAWSEIADLARLGEVPLDAGRLERVVERTPDATASLRARELMVDAARRTRFSDTPEVLARDPFADHLAEWRVLGPYGPLDHPAPLHLAPRPGAPELGLRPTHPSEYGVELAWRPLRRGAEQLVVLPARGTPHHGDGLCYLVTHVALEGEALLEVHCPRTCQVWWNGERVLDLSARGPAENRDRFRVPVASGGDWNELLVRVENEVGARIAARLIDRETGRSLPPEELPADAPRPARPPFVPPAEPSAEEEAPTGGLARAVRALEHLAAGRADRALALSPADLADSADGELARAWQRVRFEALSRQRHLPSEVERRRRLALAAEMEAAGGLLSEAWAQRVMRLVDEDRPAEALDELDALQEAGPPNPSYATLRLMALSELDGTGVLTREELRDLRGRFPRSGRLAALLARSLEEAGDEVGALVHWRAALALAGDDHGVQERALRAMARAGGEALAGARRLLADWHADSPDLRRPRELQELVLRTAGEDEALEALLRENVAEAPASDPQPGSDLADFLIARGRYDEARGLLREILELVPGAHEARATLARLGEEHAAERFFEAFAPDREEALAAAEGPHDASIAEALDSGLVYLYPDGSSHERYHTITLALDREGTERLHTEPVADHARLARVLKPDGDVLEPSEVGGEWVMPNLSPGDAVELIWDQFTRGRPGAPPGIGWWRFSSFEKPFVRSRYVIYVPDGLPGELRPFHFDGQHEQHRFEGGTVHVFLAQDRPRQEEERFRPSYEEILPWVQYGGDLPRSYAEALWRDRLEVLAHLPADLERELRAVVAGLDVPPGEEPEALFEAVTDHVLDFRGGALAAQVWPSKRGNPIFLLGALYELAEVPFEWAVLRERQAPELDQEPVQAFQDLRGYDVPALRVAGEPPVWVLAPEGRGQAFGHVPAEAAGAVVMVLGEDGARTDTLPRDQLDETWDLDLDVRYDLGPDGTAAVGGTLRITTSRGPLLREQLAQASSVQRGGAARQLAGQMIPGLDLEQFEFPRLEERGAPFELVFSGSVPSFVRERGGGWRAALPIQPTGLARNLGAADRRWPLALRSSQRQRVRVTVAGEGWQVTGGPHAFREEREGFLHALEVEATDGAWHAERTFLLRGLMLPPEEVPAFLAREAELEKETQRALVLERAE